MTDSSFTIEYKNNRPIEVLDLAASLGAVGDQFKRFVTYKDGIDTGSRLFVHEIRPGSTVAELIALGRDAADLYDAVDKLSGFAPYLHTLLHDILHLRKASKYFDRPTIRNAAQIVRPTSIDNKGNLNLIENNGGTVNILTVTPVEAAAIMHNANHLLNSQFPDEERFVNEPMILFQLRDAPPGKTGDFGIIDRFSARPRKLLFASDAIKSDILHAYENPFEVVFWVDGAVKTAGGKVEAYVIEYLRDTTPRAD